MIWDVQLLPHNTKFLTSDNRKISLAEGNMSFTGTFSLSIYLSLWSFGSRLLTPAPTQNILRKISKNPISPHNYCPEKSLWPLIWSFSLEWPCSDWFTSQVQLRGEDWGVAFDLYQIRQTWIFPVRIVVHVGYWLYPWQSGTTEHPPTSQ